jgi:predicted dehydrogenase
LKTPFRLGIIGCGTVVEQFHLPSILARDDCQITALVDQNLRRADALQRHVPGAVKAMTSNEVLAEFDAAIVAVPHFLHATFAIELLSAGKSVLVEKPMALSTAECKAMLEAATRNATITIGHMRRFLPTVAAAKHLLAGGTFGKIRRVDIRDGVVFGWPVQSDFQFRKEKAGGGVLVDTGGHALDMVIYWFGDPKPLSYRDNACGGVEADCEAELQLPSGAECVVELSRTRNLRNSAIIQGERGCMEVFFYANKLTFKLQDSLARRIPFDCVPQARALSDPSPWRQMFDLQLEDWLSSLRKGRQASVSGTEGVKVVRLIEQLYALRKPLIHSWESFDERAL